MRSNKLKTILVTGGAGYVGSVLIPKLLKKNYRVKVLDLYMYGNVFEKIKKNKNLIQIKGDIRNRQLLKKALDGSDGVIHLACISNDPSFELNPHLGKSINYDATLSLTDLAKEAGIQRFIYASSSSVYGVKKEKNVTEDLSLEPLTDYSKYKAQCETYILNTLKNVCTTLILRPATVCGYSPRLRLDLTVNILTIHALVKKQMTVHGGVQLRPNIHIEDMTDLYVKTLEYKDALINGKTYNAGYENYSLLEISKMVKRVLSDKTIQVVVTPTKDLRSYKISSKKIKKELGFTPKHTIEDAIFDLQKAYNSGKITDPLNNIAYYNIATMKKVKLT